MIWAVPAPELSVLLKTDCCVWQGSRSIHQSISSLWQKAAVPPWYIVTKLTRIHKAMSQTQGERKCKALQRRHNFVRTPSTSINEIARLRKAELPKVSQSLKPYLKSGTWLACFGAWQKHLSKAGLSTLGAGLGWLSSSTVSASRGLSPDHFAKHDPRMAISISFRTCDALVSSNGSQKNYA